MQTLEKTSLEYANKYVSGCRDIYPANQGEFIDAFEAGYSFAKQWTDIKDEKPEYYLPVIVEGNMIVWRAWSESFGDIYTINGTDVVLSEEPKKWRPI